MLPYFCIDLDDSRNWPRGRRNFPLCPPRKPSPTHHHSTCTIFGHCQNVHQIILRQSKFNTNEHKPIKNNVIKHRSQIINEAWLWITCMGTALVLTQLHSAGHVSMFIPQQWISMITWPHVLYNVFAYSTLLKTTVFTNMAGMRILHWYTLRALCYKQIFLWGKSMGSYFFAMTPLCHLFSSNSFVCYKWRQKHLNQCLFEIIGGIIYTTRTIPVPRSILWLVKVLGWGCIKKKFNDGNYGIR